MVHFIPGALWDEKFDTSMDCSETVTRHDPSEEVFEPKSLINIGRNGVALVCLTGGCDGEGFEGAWHPMSISMMKRAEITKRILKRVQPEAIRSQGFELHNL